MAKNKRSTDWNEEVSARGLEVDIIRDGMKEPCAYTMERILIGIYGSMLVNRSPGGVGAHQWDYAKRTMRAAILGRKPHNYGKKLPEWHKKILNDVRPKFQSDETKKKRSDAMSGKKHPQLDKENRIFIHKDGRRFEGLRYDFIKKYDLSPAKVCLLIKGSRKHHKGWSLP